MCQTGHPSAARGSQTWLVLPKLLDPEWPLRARQRWLYLAALAATFFFPNHSQFSQLQTGTCFDARGGGPK